MRVRPGLFGEIAIDARNVAIIGAAGQRPGAVGVEGQGLLVQIQLVVGRRQRQPGRAQVQGAGLALIQALVVVVDLGQRRRLEAVQQRAGFLAQAGDGRAVGIEHTIDLQPVLGLPVPDRLFLPFAPIAQRAVGGGQIVEACIAQDGLDLDDVFAPIGLVGADRGAQGEEVVVGIERGARSGFGVEGRGGHVLFPLWAEERAIPKDRPCMIATLLS
nr:hypothetical protein [Magnetospirillum moscoviense]